MTATAASPLMHAPTRDAVMSQAATENFPVATWLLGPRARSRLLAIYGFARLVDDAGDEAAGDRLELLGAIERDLDAIYDGAAPAHPVNLALAPVIRELSLPADPFRALIEANRRDQHVARYGSFEELFDYCRLSAAPVGELVLRVFGAATPDRVALSDRICAGLQVTEHLQDVAEDRARGRVYLPADDLAQFGVGDEDLVSREATPAFRSLMAFEVARARALLRGGAPLIGMLAPRPALAVVGFVAGGRAALDAIEAADHDVLSARPRPDRRAFALAAIGTLPWIRPRWR